MKHYSLIAAFALLSSAQPIAPVVTARAAARFLDQATWGPTAASIAQVQSMGFTAWLQAQYALNTSDLPDQPILNSAGTSNNNLGPVQAAFFQNAVANQDQLRQRMAFILSQIWVVSQQSGVPQAYAYPPYWRLFRDNAFGNYKDVIKAITLSPAMGRYLNMANNNKASSAKGTVPNENYARELMQLFTLGLNQLNPDGSLALDANQNIQTTYTQPIVTAMSLALTGWTYPTAPGATAKNNNPAFYTGTMFSVDAEHDKTAKTIFGNVTIPSGQTAEQDLDAVIAALMAQPTMAPFISQQLIQHLVTSNPSPGYITRISTVFSNDGTGVSGNLQAVITAILTDPEARAGDDDTISLSPTFGKMREPILFMTDALRGLNATVGATSTISNDASNMGENLFNAGSVFSYFSPQSKTEHGLFGPEFQIYSTQTAADRVNYVNSILYGTGATGFKINLAPFVSQAGDPATLLNYIGSIFLHSGMSSELQSAATTAIDAATTPTAKVQAALYVVLTSSEYQIIQ
ncbi:MAG TPA: DUF1800 domain-containing protein [Bryobacteraceae bacterium]|jgi:uncharacterized protein (DUF1800 family)|nr:DUF1800 domain-containing protein [Bryobacteraceae bacterium]